MKWKRVMALVVPLVVVLSVLAYLILPGCKSIPGDAQLEFTFRVAHDAAVFWAETELDAMSDDELLEFAGDFEVVQDIAVDTGEALMQISSSIADEIADRGLGPIPPDDPTEVVEVTPLE